MTRVRDVEDESDAVVPTSDARTADVVAADVVVNPGPAVTRDTRVGSDRAQQPAGSPTLGRRSLLTAAAVALPVAGSAAVATVAARPADASTLFAGPHPAGITDPPLPFVVIAGFDLLTPHRAELAELLRIWNALGARLSSTERTVTIGFGPALFERTPLGLGPDRPAALKVLPAFAGEALDRVGSNGDLGVQICASSPAAASRAMRSLVTAARPLAGMRWRQVGYREQDGTSDPRGPFDFRDGTANLDVTDPVATARHLWVNDGPQWLHGGSYLVVRRIRLIVDTWDRTGLADQEALIGRTRHTNQRTGGGHAQLARPETNGGATLLRRSYSYDAGVDANGLQDTGLIFIAFQQDPGRQFVPVQQRLAGHDQLNAFSQHTASAVFACPAGPTAQSWLDGHLTTTTEST